MMGTETDWLRLIPLLPLIGAATNTFLGQRWGPKASGIIASTTVAGSLALSLTALTRLQALPAASLLRDSLWNWISSGTFRADLSLMVDPLTAVMILVVSGVGFLIHVYSIGYMEGDESIPRYFAYLNLFVFFMLLLVMADNLVLMFVGWEGVGLCSYLLIGFWYEEKGNCVAGGDAFVVNRIGDLGFLLGLFLLSWALIDLGARSLGFAEIAEKAALLDPTLVMGVTLLLFVGAIGKSAQIPLYVWLPDAMAGPTPVSALIHAATMVTAGVYMIARLNFLYLISPVTLHVVALVGLATSLFAASIALVQNDIKKILAYSTVSQIGMMFVGIGVAAFIQAIFHLMTHSFFKALLFMGAGSVMHGMEGEQDLRKMGGLGQKMPVTMVTFLVASLAISGVPGFSGYYSKDAILWMSHVSPLGNPSLWMAGVLVAGLTAFYIFRLFFLAFFGASRSDIQTWAHLHESPRAMTLPLILLAILSLIGGWWATELEGFLSPVLKSPVLGHDAEKIEGTLTLVSVTLATGGMILAAIFYLWSPSIPHKLTLKLPSLHRLLARKYYVDEMYDAVLVSPLQRGSMWLWKAFDVQVIDRLVNGLGNTVLLSSAGWRQIQTGNVQHYALGFLVGTVVILGVILWGL
jgi:NADH-quinone oxidoreductase subunit L